MIFGLHYIPHHTLLIVISQLRADGVLQVGRRLPVSAESIASLPPREAIIVARRSCLGELRVSLSQAT
ncbi:hypothetical protein PISMIDRAFT_681999 [Pisolithus microcarpus 441]|uniref:Uncharacterized protein n=1 Tax=Pisolithus microcarpus 441 TaxID=765257 RepID=A0A0C9ZEB6_9AGAM|nr:hypothetical protein PISMIDRAFT_681999 [Pisolithus microcarpus 441]